MKIIKATKGTEEYNVMVDDVQFEIFNLSQWRYDYYVYMVSKGREKIRMVNFLLPEKEGFIVDHIDGNPLNNQRENLRYATTSQNTCKQRRGRVSKLGYKGVYRSSPKDPHPFYSQIRVNGMAKTLGTFDSVEEAAWAYNIAAVKYHGEFATLNNLTKTPQFIGPTLP